MDASAPPAVAVEEGDAGSGEPAEADASEPPVATAPDPPLTDTTEDVEPLPPAPPRPAVLIADYDATVESDAPETECLPVSAEDCVKPRANALGRCASSSFCDPYPTGGVTCLNYEVDEQIVLGGSGQSLRLDFDVPRSEIGLYAGHIERLGGQAGVGVDCPGGATFALDPSVTDLTFWVLPPNDDFDMEVALKSTGEMELQSGPKVLLNEYLQTPCGQWLDWRKVCIPLEALLATDTRVEWQKMRCVEAAQLTEINFAFANTRFAPEAPLSGRVYLDNVGFERLRNVSAACELPPLGLMLDDFDDFEEGSSASEVSECTRGLDTELDAACELPGPNNLGQCAADLVCDDIPDDAGGRACVRHEAGGAAPGGSGSALRIDFDVSADSYMGSYPYAVYQEKLLSNDSARCEPLRSAPDLELLELSDGTLSFWVRRSSNLVEAQLSLKDARGFETSPKVLLSSALSAPCGERDGWQKLCVPLSVLATDEENLEQVDLSAVWEANFTFAVFQGKAKVGTLWLDEIAIEAP